MKLMRLAVCAAVFALMGGIVLGEDVAALQAKLAAQEARLNDLQAKMNNVGVASCAAPEAITSLRKNATVTVGGYFNTRYYYKNSELQSKFGPTGAGAGAGAGFGDGDDVAPVLGNNMRTISTNNYGDMKLGDTALEFKIDVNEYFDAYIELNFNDYNRDATGPAKNYWMRWKNLCNTGFGVLVGRDNLRFGGIQSYGFFDSFGNGTGDSAGDAFGGWGNMFNPDSDFGSVFASTGGMVGFGSDIVPTHTIWNDARTIQVTPYWESQDGKILAELSFFQAIENDHGVGERIDRDGSRRKRSINNGFGSFSGRLTWKPIEGLTVMASAMNQHADQKDIDDFWGWNGNIVKGALTGVVTDSFDASENNFATNLGFEYRPCFFNRLNVFASWTHGWNEGWIKDQDSDSINYGLGIDLNESLTWYATGDYLKVTSDNNTTWNKATGWAYETGLKYTLPYGVDFTAAWRHDNIKFKSRGGDTHTKYKSDMFVVHAGFSF